MKNYLLLIAAALVATSASAQQPVQKAKFIGTDFATKVAPNYLNVYENKKSATPTPSIRRAQGTAANPTAFYKRPKGTLYLAFDDELGGYDKSMAVYPPYAPVSFQNASANPSATSWFWGTNALTSANASNLLDASNNLNIPLGFLEKIEISNGSISTYNPFVLVNGADSFSIADAIAPLTGYFGCGYSITPLQSGFYYGGAGPTAYFGDRDVTTTRKQIAYYQPFDKPIGALSLNKISLFAWRNGGNLVSGASNMKVYIYNVETESDGSKILGDSLIATFDFVADSVKYNSSWSAGSTGSTCGVLPFYPLVDDGLGGQMVQPVNLSDEFAVLVTGFSGQNIGFYFAQAEDKWVQSESSDGYVFDSSVAPNARFLAQDSNDNRIYDYSYVYNMYPVIMLHGYENYAGFDESSTDEKGIVTSFTEFTAAPGGGVAVNDSGYVGQLFTALPWQDADGFDNYTINIDYGNETPWLEGLVQNEDGTYSISQIASSTNIDVTKSFVNTANWEDYGIQVVGFSAQALPAGKTGRHAIISINANGYESNKIVVRQGDDNFTAADGIEAITVNGKKATNGRTYNIGGQQVNKAYKGVVIRDGKKFIQ